METRLDLEKENLKNRYYPAIILQNKVKFYSW